MSELTIGRIAASLDRFNGLIDMSDTDNRPEEEGRQHFLSRALAAYCVMRCGRTSLETAANAVTDGYNDGGIDALYLDQATDTLYLVTSKWSDIGKNPIDLGDATKFAQGVKDLLSARLSQFNEKFRRKEGEIRVALQNPGKFVLISTQMAQGELGNHPLRIVEDLMMQLNEVDPVARREHYDRTGIMRLMMADADPAQISLDIELEHWGHIDKPYWAVYGRVRVAYLVKWWNDHHRALSRRNLRHLLPRTDVNEAMRKTALEEPENFWYFNNGITIICDNAQPSLGSRGQRDIGTFRCENISVINGAQTVGVLGSTLNFDDAVKLTDSWVQVRIISLSKAPPNFDKRITTFTNLQNRVAPRDFAALDPQQQRLAREFALFRRVYSLKSGDEPDPQGDEGCSLVEASQALACANSMALAVQIKREIGQIWSDITKPPYTDLFNERLSGDRVWRSVAVMRAVDGELKDLSESNAPRADLISIHLNRAILHLVFRDPRIYRLMDGRADIASLEEAAKQSTRAIFPKVAEYLDAHHKDEYLAAFAKNQNKCKLLIDVMRAKPEQSLKFIEVAGELGCDEEETVLDETVKKVAKNPPPQQEGKPKPTKEKGTRKRRPAS